MKLGLLSWLRHQKGLVLQYQLHNRVENFAAVSTRCSGLLQDEDLRPEEDQSIWSKRRQGFQPCCEAGIREPTLSQVVLLMRNTQPTNLHCALGL